MAMSTSRCDDAGNSVIQPSPASTESLPHAVVGVPSLDSPRPVSNVLQSEDLLCGSTGKESRTQEEKGEDNLDSAPTYQSTTAPLEDDLHPLLRPHQEAVQGDGMAGRAGAWFRRQWREVLGVQMTRRQWLMMVVLGLVTFTSSFAVCLFPPFFPELAESKGAGTSLFGVIIGTNCLVAFLVTPTVGKNLERIGVKFSFVMGAVASGGCCILSGFLEWFPPGWEFVVEAMAIRAVHACSNAFVITSTFAFIVAEFPNNIAKLFAMTRTMMNLAQMLGPVVGGGLYELGGFKLPFLVMGGIQMTVALISVYALPNYRKKSGSEKGGDGRVVTLREVVRIPGMWVSFCTFIFSTMSNGFLSITLEAFVLRKFSISHIHVGFMFGLKDGANSLTSPLWGFVCDRVRSTRPVILCSTVLAAASFVLLGPFPGLPVAETHALAIVALLINGFGIGGQQVAGVVHAMNMAQLADLPDDAATHGFIAGLWSSLSGAGRFVSRAGSGWVVNRIGFRYGTMIVVFLHVIVFVVTAVFMAYDRMGDLCGDRPNPRSPPLTPRHHPQCTVHVCVCGRGVTVINTCTPSDAVVSKAISVPMPNVREDLEDSMAYGSFRSIARTPPSLRTLLQYTSSHTTPRCLDQP